MNRMRGRHAMGILKWLAIGVVVVVLAVALARQLGLRRA
jgi:hypothetical protein